MELHLFGIPVRIQNSFWMIAGIYLLFGLQGRSPIAYILAGVFCLFASVLWHEGGHALVATLYKLGPVNIEIHGLGGTTYHRRRAPEWWKNLLVILAGPGAGFLLAALSLVGLIVAPAGLMVDFLVQMVAFNIFMSVLNLIPVFPMDGGQALLTTLSGLKVRSADLWTANVGIVGAVGLSLFSLWMFVSGRSLGILLFVALQMLYQNWELRNAALSSRR